MLDEQMTGEVRPITGRLGLCELIRPTAEQVLEYTKTVKPRMLEAPSNNSDEWDRDHSEYMLHCLLPQLRLPQDILRITAETYMTKVKYYTLGITESFEQGVCNGSSFVPDTAYPLGNANVKDWMSMGHDFINVLHNYHMPDAFGHRWTYCEWNSYYRRAWYAEKRYWIGTYKYLGLMAGGWMYWE